MDPTAPAVPPAAPAAPEGVPAKFVRQDGSVDIAGLAKSYTELERSRSAPPAAPPAAPAPPSTARFTEIQSRAAAEMQHGGRVADSTYAEFESIGIPRQVVDNTIAGMKAQQDAYQSAVVGAAGSKENFDAMTAWGRVNSTPAEQQAFQQAVSSGNPMLAQWAVQNLKSQYDAAHGTEGVRVSGTTPPSGGSGAVQPFQQLGEVTAAMKDKQYNENPAFRETVKQRLAASHRSGIDLGLRIMHNGQRIA